MLFEMLYLSVSLLSISSGCDAGEVREPSEFPVDPGWEPCALITGRLGVTERVEPHGGSVEIEVLVCV